MVVRAPSTQALANSSARFGILIRQGQSWSVVELGRGWLIALAVVSGLLLVTASAGALYHLFRDSMLHALAQGQGRDTRAYEERIAELRQRIDRMTTRQIVNQDSIEDRVAILIAKQAELEARSLLIGDLEDRAQQVGLSTTRGSTVPAANQPTSGTGFEARFPLPAAILGGTPAPRERETKRPMPIEDDATGSIRPNAFAPNPLPTRPPELPKSFEIVPFRGAIKDVVGEIDQRTRMLEKAQMEAMRGLATDARERAERHRRVIAATGLNPSRFGDKPAPAGPKSFSPLALRDVRANSDTAQGGPLLPAELGPSGTAVFDQMLSEADRAIRELRTTRQIVARLPLARPVAGDHDLTSGFGTRLDPFTRSLAFHSGVDFRAPTGTPVRATASGTVIEAGTNGGYGRMVEIDHGNGVSTRYAHLSSIAVSEGDKIALGQVIGAVGSTGRSTGPHLHYEVRIDDDAADPLRFLRAQRLARD
jgi:murein DD-endopeptidase MepM/ murein hydrolase activator NlpD